MAGAADAQPRLAHRLRELDRESTAARIFREPREPYTRALVAAAFALESAGAGVVGE